jgi:hypothetical protein
MGLAFCFAALLARDEWEFHILGSGEMGWCDFDFFGLVGLI